MLLIIGNDLSYDFELLFEGCMIVEVMLLLKVEIEIFEEVDKIIFKFIRLKRLMRIC